MLKNRNRWVPYILIAPSLLYLALFFAYPMVQSLQLAFTSSEQAATLRAEPRNEAAVTGTLPMQTDVQVLERAGLIERGREAQWRPAQLQTAPLEDVSQWLENLNWESNFDRLQEYIRKLQVEK